MTKPNESTCLGIDAPCDGPAEPGYTLCAKCLDVIENGPPQKHRDWQKEWERERREIDAANERRIAQAMRGRR